MSYTEAEIASQPDCWRRAADLVQEPDGAAREALPRAGERVAVVGCGTSWFIAQSYAALRESAGQVETDAFAASEMPPGRRYDRVLALCRSGTTTEVLELLRRLRGTAPTTVVTAVPGSPVTEVADSVVLLDFADERSVVQTRFATTEIVLLRAHLGASPRRWPTACWTPSSSPSSGVAGRTGWRRRPRSRCAKRRGRGPRPIR